MAILLSWVLAAGAVPAWAGPSSSSVGFAVLDRHGAPVADAEVYLVNGSTGGSPTVYTGADGHAAITLPNGFWTAMVRVVTPAANGDRETISMVVKSDFSVTHDEEVVLDARSAIRVQSPIVEGQWTRVTDFGMAVSRVDSGEVGSQKEMKATAEQVRAGDVFITPTEPVKVGFFEAAALWRLEPVGPRADSTPDAYLVYDVQDHVAATPKIVSHHELARMARVVHHNYTSSDDNITVVTTGMSPHNVTGFPIIQNKRAGSVETDLVTADPSVQFLECLFVPGEDSSFCQPSFASYEAGAKVELHEGRGLHVDAVPHQTYQAFGYITLSIGRSDGTFSEHLSDQSVDAARTTLYRNDVLVGTAPSPSAAFAVPDERATFRLVNQINSHRGSVRTDAQTTWTFSSESKTDGNVSTPPMLGVDYGPQVDGYGMTPQGQNLTFKIGLQHLPGSSSTAKIQPPSVAWTVDNGKSWNQARVHPGPDGRYVLVVPGDQLRSGGSVGLNVSAIDTDGNSVEQKQLGLAQIL